MFDNQTGNDVDLIQSYSKWSINQTSTIPDSGGWTSQPCEKCTLKVLAGKLSYLTVMENSTNEGGKGGFSTLNTFTLTRLCEWNFSLLALSENNVSVWKILQKGRENIWNENISE